MDDLISRQTAQRLFANALTYQERVGRYKWITAEAKQWIADFIEDLPSAQPEIIRCKDCRYWGAYPSSSATPWLHECYARIARLHTAADEFCSRAERREVSE